MRYLVVLALLAGCGGDSSPCKDAVTSASKRVKMRDQDVDRAIKRCERDKWSSAMRTCIADATDEDELARCRRKHAKDEEDDEPDKGMRDGRKRPEATSTLAVTGIEPVQGDPEGGTYVLLRGNRFTADGPRNAKVYFGSRAGSVIRFSKDSELIVRAPAGKPGETVDVLVVFEPGGELRLRQAYTYVAKSP